MEKEKKKNDHAKKLGRPTNYKEEYCDIIVEEMAKGLSFEASGGDKRIAVSKDTLYQWLKKYPAFSDAKKKGENLCLNFWERIGIGRALGKVPKGCAASYIFNMKNRFLWRDRLEVNGKTEIVGQEPIFVNVNLPRNGREQIEEGVGDGD